ncbi:NAD-dependent epimerase/dehydratase family protein [Pendulispora albinea]|uniref:NAD-dependent epimerase/dehydratase family protein n=1 Tax=Pendulispora albinea TaxID=2741071 RepID=A0ABZ2M113_9BACT
MTRERPLHVILGAGQIGSLLATALLEQGHRVRLVRKGPAGQALPNLEHESGDITDLAFAERATRGASVVYDCMNPPYHRWPELLLPIAKGALHGAARAGAKLIALDCLYMYGRPTGPMDEDTPMNPCSKKGALRVELANMRLAAHARGEVRVAIGRASDFFGPNLPYSAWSARFFERVYAGKPAECLGNPDMPHSYTYAPDIARALVTLGERDDALGRAWHLPTSRAESTRALARRIGRALDRDVNVVRVPKIALRAMGVFVPFLREAVEMTYQWEVPFVLDDTRFRTTFGVGPTPIDDAVDDTAAWARRQFS